MLRNRQQHKAQHRRDRARVRPLRATRRRTCLPRLPNRHRATTRIRPRAWSSLVGASRPSRPLGYARIKNPLFRERAAETVGWLRREMTTPEGGFASSLDADSEGEEGKFYVWSLEEVEHALGPADAAPYAAGDSAAFFAAKYNLSRNGNFENSNILNRLNGLADTSDEAGRLAMLRSMLQQERTKRVRPGLDDKVLADWNGLMIAALAHSAAAFDAPDWIEPARTAFDFVARSMTQDDRLGHSWRAGRLLIPGLASDYAAMIRAALAIFEAS